MENHLLQTIIHWIHHLAIPAAGLVLLGSAVIHRTPRLPPAMYAGIAIHTVSLVLPALIFIFGAKEVDAVVRSLPGAGDPDGLSGFRAFDPSGLIEVSYAFFILQCLSGLISAAGLCLCGFACLNMANRWIAGTTDLRTPP